MSWNEAPVIRWLLEDGRRLPTLAAVVGALGPRLLAQGAPLWRVRYSMRTVHPLVTAVSAVWERDGAATTPLQAAHGLEQRSGYIGSPMAQLNNSDHPLRRRLDTLTASDHAVFHELRQRGATDYFGLRLPFSSGSNGIAIFVTDAAEGFSDDDLSRLNSVATALTPIAEVFRLQNLSTAIAEAYLGPRTGQRVLSGQITRGDIETIDAAILVSDIRDWTGWSARLAPPELLAMANRYFELLDRAVSDHGGEILKFLGDGVLAVFPDAGNAEQACQSALDAALAAIDAAARLDPPLPLSFGTGLHFGQVLYGNIGAEERLDFTVLGQAVNIAARIESLCAGLGQPVLMSREIAERVRTPTARTERVMLKGVTSPQEIYTPSE
ncbi:adenylate/guanylate cyclase domain-containing protein [Ruegeria sp. 2012CJ41-6]|uniref:Adenylate/guanylate cyclase domain-containing protein n=1 Tax=Ruegeria spongiae TaxID=2942209 RepID=A0ABT0PZB2_9RHOB|nr:adenylate/guanylate cyclase domain-containing protein [Ruegeria spongiae]MCL6282512.1 adenylate/guanylate cyclase domain-containing protein [Ruegeria spongiae]